MYLHRSALASGSEIERRGGTPHQLLDLRARAPPQSCLSLAFLATFCACAMRAVARPPIFAAPPQSPTATPKSPQAVAPPSHSPIARDPPAVQAALKRLFAAAEAHYAARLATLVGASAGASATPAAESGASTTPPASWNFEVTADDAVAALALGDLPPDMLAPLPAAPPPSASSSLCRLAPSTLGAASPASLPECLLAHRLWWLFPLPPSLTHALFPPSDASATAVPPPPSPLPAAPPLVPQAAASPGSAFTRRVPRHVATFARALFAATNEAIVALRAELREVLTLTGRGPRLAAGEARDVEPLVALLEAPSVRAGRYSAGERRQRVQPLLLSGSRRVHLLPLWHVRDLWL